MDTIIRGISGNETLATINQVITQQENRNSLFLDSQIVYEDSTILNKVTFQLFDDATVPKSLAFKKKSEPPPENTSVAWEGILVAENSLQVIIGYRSK